MLNANIVNECGGRYKEGGSMFLFVKNRIPVYEMSKRWIGTMRIKDT